MSIGTERSKCNPWKIAPDHEATEMHAIGHLSRGLVDHNTVFDKLCDVTDCTLLLVQTLDTKTITEEFFAC